MSSESPSPILMPPPPPSDAPPPSPAPPSPATQPVRFHTALRELLVIAAPTIATMTSYTLMQFADKLMTSRIGPDPVYVGAQGNGGLASFVPIAIAMGFLTVINTYVAQNLGAGKPERGPAYAWTGLWMSLAYWLVLLLPLGLALPWVFELFRPDSLTGEALASAVRRDTLAGEYGRILLLGGFFTMATRGIAQYFYGMHRPAVVLIASLAGNATNLFLNSLLIYGSTQPAWRDGAIDVALAQVNAFTRPIAESLGMSPMGILGAAIATVVGTVVEFLIPLLLFVSRRYHREFKTRASWRFSPAHARDLFKIGWPGALMFGNEMICWAFFMVYLVGSFGPMHSTAGWIAHQWMTLSFMPTVGLSIAVTATVGKCLGANRPDLAAHRAWTGLALALGYMGTCGVLFIVLGREMIGLFIEPTTPAPDQTLLLSLGVKFLIATAAFQLFDAVAMILSGALRGAGDTVWPGVATVISSWTIIVLGGWAMTRYFPQLESVGPWIAAATYIFALSAAMLVRFLSGKWKSMKLLEHSAGAH